MARRRGKGCEIDWAKFDATVSLRGLSDESVAGDNGALAPVELRATLDPQQDMVGDRRLNL